MKKICKTLSIILVAVMIGMFAMPMTAVTADASPRFSADQTFNGTGTPTDATEYIYCDSSVVVEDVYKYSSAPSYGNSNNSITNACSPMAGANICGFYDRWSDNLIPNYTTGMANGSSFMYISMGSLAPIQTLVVDLYNAMGTNVGGDGTTQSGFENGLASYASSKGYGTSFQSIKTSSTTVDLNALRTAIYNDKVAVISLTNYNLVTARGENNGYVELRKYTYNVGHMMMVYGFETVAYYSGGNNFRTDTYLYVSTGYNSGMRAQVLLGSNLNIIESDIVYIG